MCPLLGGRTGLSGWLLLPMGGDVNRGKTISLRQYGG